MFWFWIMIVYFCCICFFSVEIYSWFCDSYVVFDEYRLVVSMDREENLYKRLCESVIKLILIIYCFVVKK